MLPESFADLEPLAESGWCLATEAERVAKRHASTAEELRNFYDLMVPRLETVIAHLDRFELDTFPKAEQQLMHLLLSMAEVTFAVEKFDSDESTYEGLPASRFVPVHDLPAGGLYTPFEYK
jgi:hypothetical protein